MHLKSSPHHPPLFRRMLQHCLAVMRHKTSTRFSSAWQSTEFSFFGELFLWICIWWLLTRYYDKSELHRDATQTTQCKIEIKYGGKIAIGHSLYIVINKHQPASADLHLERVTNHHSHKRLSIWNPNSKSKPAHSFIKTVSASHSPPLEARRKGQTAWSEDDVIIITRRNSRRHKAAFKKCRADPTPCIHHRFWLWYFSWLVPFWDAYGIVMEWNGMLFFFCYSSL